jgi:hypothetical protein
MAKSEIVCGLPWFSSKPEKAIFTEQQYACVYAVGPVGGRPLRLGWSKQLQDRMREIQAGYWKQFSIHEVTWTVGDMLSIRVFNEVTAMFDKASRRLTGDWFDVTPEFAAQAIRLASDKLGIPTFSHGEMMERVRAIRKSQIEKAIRNS